MSVDFRWKRPARITEALKDLLPETKLPFWEDHLEPLVEFSRDVRWVHGLAPTTHEIKNMRALGRCTHNLIAVILLEPAMSSRTEQLTDIWETPTLKCIDDMLRWCSKGTYNAENTAIMDVRTFLIDASKEGDVEHIA